MPWQAAIFAGLVLVLVAGFAWYERSRPPSRLVALVAALAALAVAGRLVLAPIPNVVATTDVALLTGYAIGGAPGFMVGALAAPVSNLWLGQGPWTPWQMAGWGLAGLAGAGLAAATGRRLGRLGLASACAAMGFAYGALLDLSVMVTYGGEQSLDRYLAISARGIPFNLAHAAGNFAIALAAGPALVRMLSRFRTRFEVRWPRRSPSAPGIAGRTGLAAILVVATLGHALVAEPPPAAGAGLGSGRAWLERAQNGDGGFAATPGGRSSAAMTGWAMLGLEAAGRNPLDVRAGGRSPLAYLRSEADRVRSTGDLERTILALAGAGVSTRSFAGRDLVAELRARRDGDGSFDGQVNLTAFGILALRTAGAGDLGQSGAWLRHARNGDGGWGFSPGAGSDPDSTGAALQGLAAAGGGGLSDGIAYLRRVQRGDGGWGLNETGVTNTQSTAWAVQGLVAARSSTATLRRGLGYVVARQAGDGHYRYSRSTDQTPIWVTSQALLAVGGEALPIEPVPRSAGDPSPQPDVSVPIAGGAPGSTDGDSRPDRRRDREDEEGRRRGDEKAADAAGRELTAAPASVGTPADGDDDGPGKAVYVAGGLGLLAAALGAGFLWYRRTLP